MSGLMQLTGKQVRDHSLELGDLPLASSIGEILISVDDNGSNVLALKKHSDLSTADGVHHIHAFNFSSISERDSFSPQSSDIGKACRIGNTFYILQSTSPTSWMEIGGSSSAPLTWGDITERPTTLSGYGITDAAAISHAHGNVTSTGTIGSTAGVPIITGASGVLQAGTFGSSAGTFCQGNDSRLSDARTPTSHAHGNITNSGAIGSTANLPIVTGTSGVLTVGSYASTTTTLSTTAGTAGTSAAFARGDHTHTVTPAGIGAAPASHAANASTYGYGDTTNAGHLRVGAGLAVTTGTVRANINDAGKAATELMSAQALDNICCAISRASYLSGVDSAYDSPSPDIPSSGVAAGLAVSYDGSTIVMSNGTNPFSIYKLDSTTKRFLRTAAPLSACQYPSLSYNGQRLVGLINANYLITYAWDGANNRFSEGTAVNTQPVNFNRVVMSADGNFLVATSSSQTPYIWSYKWSVTNNRYELTAQPDTVSAVALPTLSYNGSKLVVTSGASIISYTWNSTNNRYQINAAPDVASGTPSHKELSSDGTRLMITYGTSPYLRSYTWSSTNNRFEADATVTTAMATTVGERGAALSGDGSRVIAFHGTGGPYLYVWNSGADKYDRAAVASDRVFTSATTPQCALSGDGAILVLYHGLTTVRTNYLMIFKWSTGNNRYDFYHTFDRSKMILPGVAYE